MIARQNFCTSCAQAFCSSGVPLCVCWAMAPPEIDSDSRAATKNVLRIVFLCSYGRDFQTRVAHGISGQTVQIAKAATSRSAGKYGQICGDHLLKLRSSKADSEEHVTDWHHSAFFWISSAERSSRR